MTVKDIISQDPRDDLAKGPNRVARLRTLDADRMAEALTFLAGYSPIIFDVTLDATELCTDDDTPDPAEDIEPFCTLCGAKVGIFLRLGLDWRHYRGDGTTAGMNELFDPGHAPIIVWRPALENPC